MSSYYPSFNYLGINSRERGLVVSHFDADTGETDTFLGMEPIYTESADGSRRLDYGARYNNVATFRITTIKPDGGDLSVAEIREHLKWLTGSRQNSTLGLAEPFSEVFTDVSSVKTMFRLSNACDGVYYVTIDGVRLANNQWTYNSKDNMVILNRVTAGPSSKVNVEIAYNRIKYSFIGRITNAWQYKLDARTVGLIFEFTSVSPWAYSSKQIISESINNSKTITINNESDDLYGYTPVNVTFTDRATQILRNTKELTLGTDESSWNLTGTGSTRYYHVDTFWRFKFAASELTESWQHSARSPLVELPSGWKGKQVTLSAWIWSPDWSALDEGVTWSLCLSDGTPVRGYYGNKYSIVVPNQVSLGADANSNVTQLENSKWTRVWTTFTLDENELSDTSSPDYTFDESTHMFVQFWLRRNGEYRIYAPKLEWGDTASDWNAASGEFDRLLNITNDHTGDTTLVTNITTNEVVSINDNMLITSSNAAKVFGSSFNFVFPRLVAGQNDLIVQGTGDITLEYVYCIKIGDCAMDINVISDPIYDDDGNIQLDTLPWGRVTSTPTTLQGYGITNAYSKAEVNALIAEFEIDENELSAMLVEELG